MTELLSTDQAAKYCGLSPRTLEKFRGEGGGPCFVKLGHSVKYRAEDLAEWIMTRRRRSTSDPGDQPEPEPDPDPGDSELETEPGDQGELEADPERG